MNNFWQKLLPLDALVTEFVSFWRAAEFGMVFIFLSPIYIDGLFLNYFQEEYKQKVFYE
jgi:hypothetical protein